MSILRSLLLILAVSAGASLAACDTCGCAAKKAEAASEKPCPNCTKEKLCDACAAKKAEADKKKAESSKKEGEKKEGCGSCGGCGK